MEKERRTPVEEFEHKLSVFRQSRENIPHSDRTGMGRYAKAYRKLVTEIREQLSLYCCAQIFCGLYIPDSEEGILFLHQAASEVNSNRREITAFVLRGDADGLRDFLDRIRKEIFDRFWIPMETDLLQHGVQPDGLFIYSRCERELAEMQRN